VVWLRLLVLVLAIKSYCLCLNCLPIPNLRRCHSMEQKPKRQLKLWILFATMAYLCGCATKDQVGLQASADDAGALVALSAGKSKIIIYDLTARQVAKELVFETKVEAHKLDAAGNLIAVTLNSGKTVEVGIYGVNSGKLVERLPYRFVRSRQWVTPSEILISLPTIKPIDSYHFNAIPVEKVIYNIRTGQTRPYQFGSDENKLTFYRLKDGTKIDFVESNSVPWYQLKRKSVLTAQGGFDCCVSEVSAKDAVYVLRRIGYSMSKEYVSVSKSLKEIRTVLTPAEVESLYLQARK